MRKSLSSSRGFTLVELSVVLVVVGLIIGSVLVGSGIMQNARITATASALQSVQSAVSTYNQNYNALPGDDLKAVDHFPNGPTVSGGGNGKIGTNNSFEEIAAVAGDGPGESAILWQCLRSAGLVKGAGNDSLPMGNSFGGKIGVQNTAFTSSLSTNVVCASGIPGQAAQSLDQRLDDGDATKGKVMGGTAVNGTTSAYTSGSNYVVCMEL